MANITKPNECREFAREWRAHYAEQRTPRERRTYLLKAEETLTEFQKRKRPIPRPDGGVATQADIEMCLRAIQDALAE